MDGFYALIVGWRFSFLYWSCDVLLIEFFKVDGVPGVGDLGTAEARESIGSRPNDLSYYIGSLPWR